MSQQVLTMTAVPSSVEGGGGGLHRQTKFLQPAAITTNTVNAPVTPSFSVLAHTSDRPLQQQQQQQQQQQKSHPEEGWEF